MYKSSRILTSYGAIQKKFSRFLLPQSAEEKLDFLEVFMILFKILHLFCIVISFIKYNVRGKYSAIYTGPLHVRALYTNMLMHFPFQGCVWPTCRRALKRKASSVTAHFPAGKTSHHIISEHCRVFVGIFRS